MTKTKKLTLTLALALLLAGCDAQRGPETTGTTGAGSVESTQQRPARGASDTFDATVPVEGPAGITRNQTGTTGRTGSTGETGGKPEAPPKARETITTPTDPAFFRWELPFV